ncbi:DUF1456 family protein [Sporosarcina thermotolerans]|uniref:DUF1456 family protein n=1 Tax=Sporosarcina thermotolerans TaxID=633404 RepID=A0AAW9AA19_9BACL|nr:DUF1456 family protein [Sporosarcina thermotolerans]MDW0117458.1 DUF1456 family protein [Sporosarcina thermotolerans]WHT49636.1 DUF1456 family protein [Sporosarcina thermotolerans]
MNNNDILIRLRYALDFSNTEMVDIFKLGGIEVSKEDVLMLLTKSNEDEAENELQMKCTNQMLDSFLNGLIIYKRGKQEPKPGQPQAPSASIMTNENVNNFLLKKVKIALALTSEDMLEILEDAGITISKGELSAVLRKEGHKNYKPCLDRYARNFLKGLAIKYRN